MNNGVPPIDPAMLARLYDGDDIRRLGGCVDCAGLGHICRPCRKTRYERHGRPAWARIVFWGGYALALTFAVVAVARG